MNLLRRFFVLQKSVLISPADNDFDSDDSNNNGSKISVGEAEIRFFVPDFANAHFMRESWNRANRHQKSCSWTASDGESISRTNSAFSPRNWGES
jgi:hypothetical protein